MSDNQNDKFIQDVQKSLRESEAELDELTLAKIRTARSNAVDAVAQSHGWRWGVPVSVAATVAVTFTAVLYMQSMDNDFAGAEIAMLEDIEMLGSDESLELLEDLEFYEWLDGHVESNA